MRNLLLEIGTEEIPAKFMPPALRQLKELTERKFKEARLHFEEIKTYGTPRRIVLFVKGLPEVQKDLIEEVKGPSAKVAYDGEGNPSKAAMGFARGQGVDIKDLTIRETENGAYVFALKKVAGQPVNQVLRELLPQLVLGINFPKPMRWGNNDIKYARPIRWLTALFGNEVIVFKIGDVASGNISRGHRFLGSDKIEIPDAEKYFELMEKNFVVVDPDLRKEMIIKQIKELAFSVNGRVELDQDLLEEIVFLVEYPTALMGGFAEKYLAIPKEAVITPMKEHQRYFPVLTGTGSLMPKFITVRNGNSQYLDIVQAGNEKVLEARLADAKFFYDEDQKRKLEEYVDKLRAIVFQESLGTIYEKVERIMQGVKTLSQTLNLDKGVEERALRAAYLSKADLVTNMVYEFPELQGIMGEKYALLSGENQLVARAIFEHYLPRNAEDILPETLEGTLVSIADKIDTIAGCFAVGIEPTGSQDPYALRRQAAGICNIILDKGLDLPLTTLIVQALDNYQDKLNLEKAKLTKNIYNFFEQRVRNILAEAGHRYDVIEAIITTGYDNLNDTLLRAQAVEKVKGTEIFNKLLTAFTRANNLAKKAESDIVDENYLIETVEKELYNRLIKTQQELTHTIEQKDYTKALTLVAQLEEAINAFFEGVMVMAEDEKIKANRLAILRKITKLVEPVADLTKIVQN
ncbi:MAG: glycyl-tRNA synthetase beta chain [Clostridia bacterium]|nr:glycyl-tRNA synthetase beta chain [Clostridia bacterium]MDN5321789.1 glycyl-tRNA synthetase beta chain [Clostridia bacterium]